MIRNSHLPKFQGTRGFSSARSTPLNQDSDMNEYLFVLVSLKNNFRCITTIIQLETTRGGKYDPCTQDDAPVFDSELSVSFRLPGQYHEPLPNGRIQWGYSLLASPSPTEEAALLHMVPDWGSRTRSPEGDTPLNSCIFNLKTKELKQIRPPLVVHKRGGLVVTPSLGGHTYFMEHPSDRCNPPGPAFERYDPLKDEWKELEPIPQDAYMDAGHPRESINYTAVWVDGSTILFTVFSQFMWAYNVDKNKWYPVDCPEDWFSIILADTIVVGNTIYGLSLSSPNKVVALSIEKWVGINDDPVYKCSLSESISVPGEIEIEFEYDFESRLSRHLVHLGGVNFCLVDSHTVPNAGAKVTYQHIQVTNMKLTGEKSMTVTNKCVHRLKLEPYMQLQVTQCFSLPRNKTTDLKQGETLFNFNPYPEGFWSGQAAECDAKSYPSYRKPFQQVDNAPELVAKSMVASKVTHANEKADVEGNPFCLVKFSSHASVGELVDVLETFGSVRTCHIQVTINKTPGKQCAYVEFESKTSRQRAIEASPVEIAGRRAVILKLGRNVGDFGTPVGDLLERAELAASRGGYGGRVGYYQRGRGGGGMAKYNGILHKLRPESSATSASLKTSLFTRKKI